MKNNPPVMNFYKILDNLNPRRDKAGYYTVRESFIKKFESPEKTEELRKQLMFLRYPTWTVMAKKDDREGYISEFKFYNGNMKHKGMSYKNCYFSLFIQNNKLFKIEVRLERQ